MTKTRVFAYGIAVLATAAATLLRIAVAPLVGDGAPFLTFFVAMLFVVWYCGLRPALLCIALSAVAGVYFFVSSATTSLFLHSDRADRVTVAGFILVSIAVAFLIDLQRRTQKRLEAEVIRRKAAEAMEREQRQWFETTLASIGDAVVATDGEANVIFMNGVASELTGWDATRARGVPLQNVFRIINEQTGAEAENPISRVMEAGATVALANHTVLISRDNRRIPIDDSGAPIKRDGRVSGAVLVFRDVSARREAEREAAYLAAIVESSDDAIIGTSHDGIIQSRNAGAERLYGMWRRR
jgi:PAS domain S-box-containing protein